MVLQKCHTPWSWRAQVWMNKIVEVLPMIDQVYVRWIIHGATLRLTYSNLLIPPFLLILSVACTCHFYAVDCGQVNESIGLKSQLYIDYLEGPGLETQWSSTLFHKYWFTKSDWIHGNALELEHCEFVPVLHPSIYYLRRWTWRAGWQGRRGGWGAPSPGQHPSRRPALGRWGLAASVFGTFQHCGRLG